MKKRVGLTIEQPSQNQCWACGCSESAACMDPDTGHGCAWVNDEQNFCTNCAMLYASLVFGVAGIVRWSLEEGGVPCLA